jgi:tetratricopeptide (TPR) repeat protein
VTETKQEPPLSSGRDPFYALVLLVALILVYLPVWHAGFIWDDDDHVTANPCIVGPLGLTEIWTTSEARYYPLVLTTFWFEHALWGLNPLLFHLVNVLVQGACAVVLWRVLLSLRVPGAWLGAALWALHPVQVETVAWITELKNTQSGLFYLLSIFFFVQGLRARETDDAPAGRRAYTLTLLFAALAMLSKSSTVVLPLVLGLCAWWVEGRWHGRNVVKIAPVFLMSIAAAVMALESVALHGVVTDQQAARSLPERLITSGDVFWFYLGKLLWPHPLIFIYPRWKIDATQGLSYLPFLAMIAILFVFWRKRESWGRPWFFALAYFVIALLPVLCLVNHYFLIYSFVADHLQYLASMGPLALAGAGLSRLADAALPQRTGLRTILCAGLLLVFGTASWQRARIYGNDETLWTDTLAQNPDCWMAHNNMGQLLLEKGQPADAIAQYKKTLELNPGYAEAHYNLALALDQKGQVDAAISEYQKALEIHPDFVLARVNLGLVFMQSGRADEGMAQYEKALQTNPNYGLAHSRMGLALAQKGRLDEAIAQFQDAVANAPGLFEAHYNLGLALSQKGRLDESIEQLEAALAIDPASGDAHNNLGLALAQKGLMPEAIGEIQRALQLSPSLIGAHYNLGNAYLKIGQVNGAISEFETVVKMSPDFVEAHNNLAIALYERGRLNEAIVQFQEFVRLSPGDLNAQKNLAKAQALARQKSGEK